MTSLKSIRVSLENSINNSDLYATPTNYSILKASIKSIIALLKEEEKYECILTSEIDTTAKEYMPDKSVQVPTPAGPIGGGFKEII